MCKSWSTLCDHCECCCRSSQRVYCCSRELPAIVFSTLNLGKAYFGCTYARLINLPRLTSKAASSMPTFYDKVVGHIGSVEAMGEKYSSEALAPVLVPLIVDKLPRKLLKSGTLKLVVRKKIAYPSSCGLDHHRNQIIIRHSLKELWV